MSEMTDQQDRRLSARLREAAQEMRKQKRGAHAEAIERAAKLAELHEEFCAAFDAYWSEGSASRTLEQAANLDATQSALLAFTGDQP